MKFSEILIQLRKNNNITAKKLANELNFSVNLVYEWEKERCEPSLNTLIKLADFFGVSVDYLLGNSDDFGNIVISGSEKKETLSLKEQRLLKAFNKLSDLEKEKLIEDAEFYARLHSKTEHSNSIKK